MDEDPGDDYSLVENLTQKSWNTVGRFQKAGKSYIIKTYGIAGKQCPPPIVQSIEVLRKISDLTNVQKYIETKITPTKCSNIFEYIEGVDLLTFSGEMSKNYAGTPAVYWTLFWGIFRKIFYIIKELHKKGVVHGDLKPENFVIRSLPSNTYLITLIDFDNATTQEDYENSTYRSFFHFDTETYSPLPNYFQPRVWTWDELTHQENFTLILILYNMYFGTNIKKIWEENESLRSIFPLESTDPKILHTLCDILGNRDSPVFGDIETAIKELEISLKANIPSLILEADGNFYYEV